MIAVFLYITLYSLFWPLIGFIICGVLISGYDKTCLWICGAFYRIKNKKQRISINRFLDISMADFNNPRVRMINRVRG